jgi:hypothetical protein
MLTAAKLQGEMISRQGVLVYRSPTAQTEQGLSTDEPQQVASTAYTPPHMKGLGRDESTIAQ